MYKVLIKKHITRKYVQTHRDWYFLFGDNLARVGFGGQAKEMRGEPNAIGIVTKKEPSTKSSSYFTDWDYVEVKKLINEDFDKIPDGATVVIPADGIGTGRAELPLRAPRIYAYIERKIRLLLPEI